MKEEKIVYSNLKFQSTSQPERIQRRKEPSKGKSSGVKHRALSDLSSSWKVIAVILGIIFLALLIIGLLITKLNQKSSLSEECLRNLSFHEAQNKKVLKYPTCMGSWHQYGENCYHFSRDALSWKDCHMFCGRHGSSFLRVTTEEEKNFVISLSKMQCSMLNEKFSIRFSLNYHNKKFSEDGTDINRDKFKFPEHVILNSCTYIRNGQETTEDCQSKSYCILMCEEGIVYSSLPVRSPSPLNRSQTHGKPEERGLSSIKCKVIRASTLSWIVVILGSICLALLLTVGILAKKLNQKSHLSQEYSRNTAFTMEESERVFNSTCPEMWYQQGEKCYYFSKDILLWEDCEANCKSLWSTFLKVITEEEMDFIKLLSKIYFHVHKEKIFISFYYNITQQKWVWQDGTDLSLHTYKILGHVNSMRCGHINNGIIDHQDCNSKGYCICKLDYKNMKRKSEIS